MTHETSGLLDVLDVWAPPRVRVLEAMSYGIPAVLRTHPVYGYAPLAYCTSSIPWAHGIHHGSRASILWMSPSGVHGWTHGSAQLIAFGPHRGSTQSHCLRLEVCPWPSGDARGPWGLRSIPYASCVWLRPFGVRHYYVYQTSRRAGGHILCPCSWGDVLDHSSSGPDHGSMDPMSVVLRMVCSCPYSTLRVS